MSPARGHTKEDQAQGSGCSSVACSEKGQGDRFDGAWAFSGGRIACTEKRKSADATTPGPKKTKKEAADCGRLKDAQAGGDGAARAGQREARASPLPPPSKASEPAEDTSEDENTAGAAALADDARDGDALALSNFRLSGEAAALRKRGVAALFPIQAATFDLVYEGKDLIGRARTGMGKTLAFALPIVERVRAARPGPPRHGRPPCPRDGAHARAGAAGRHRGRERRRVADEPLRYGGSRMGRRAALRAGIAF